MLPVGNEEERNENRSNVGGESARVQETRDPDPAIHHRGGHPRVPHPADDGLAGGCARRGLPEPRHAPWPDPYGTGLRVARLRHPRGPFVGDRLGGPGEEPASGPLLQGAGLLVCGHRPFLHVLAGHPHDDGRHQRAKRLRHAHPYCGARAPHDRVLDRHGVAH